MTDSEDLRAAVLTEFKQVLKLAPADYTENCTNVVMSLFESALTKERQQYYDVFDWLLGQSGDFPVSEPGQRYAWRKELRRKIKDIDQQSKGE